MAYRQVYFRIQSDYRGYTGFSSDEQRQRFHLEASELFRSAGWEIQSDKRDCICDTAVKGVQNLYLHPLIFSGVINEDDIPQIETLLATAKSFRCCGTDRYDEYVDMSDDAYEDYLESKRTEIVTTILERCRTKRKNLYIPVDDVLTVAKRFSIHRLCDQEGDRNKAPAFVSDLVEHLIAEGKLVTVRTKYGPGLRAA